MQRQAWIQDQKNALSALLETLVNINTYTANTTGVDQGMAVLCRAAAQMGCQIEVINERHRLLKTGDSSGRRVLLLAHIDTVHPPDGDFQHYEPQDAGFVRGPGIGDMKGGLVMGLWTLLALPDLDIQMVVSANEEIGSPTIRDWYQTGGGAAFALGLEPGFPLDVPLAADAPIGVIEGRKGVGRVTFEVHGRAAHAGGDWRNGISAIQGMAQRIIKIHDLQNPAKGITTNVGLVSGGTAANTIADSAKAAVDVRFMTQRDGETVLEAIQHIIKEPTIYNPHIEQHDNGSNIDLSLFMPPMEQTPANQEMVALVVQEAQQLGQNVVPIVRGGGSDANWISSGGVPAICGMGAPAEGIHTPEERIHLPLLFQRLELLINVAEKLSKK